MTLNNSERQRVRLFCRLLAKALAPTGAVLTPSSHDSVDRPRRQQGGEGRGGEESALFSGSRRDRASLRPHTLPLTTVVWSAMVSSRRGDGRGRGDWHVWPNLRVISCTGISRPPPTEPLTLGNRPYHQEKPSRDPGHGICLSTLACGCKAKMPRAPATGLGLECDVPVGSPLGDSGTVAAFNNLW